MKALISVIVLLIDMGWDMEEAVYRIFSTLVTSRRGAVISSLFIPS